MPKGGNWPNFLDIPLEIGLILRQTLAWSQIRCALPHTLAEEDEPFKELLLVCLNLFVYQRTNKMEIVRKFCHFEEYASRSRTGRLHDLGYVARQGRVFSCLIAVVQAAHSPLSWLTVLPIRFGGK